MTGPAAIVSKCFENITDPRVDRGHNYDLVEMIFITLTAAVCGANGWVDVERFAKAKIDWFRRYVKLDNGIPSHDTLGRVFSNLDTGEFLTAMHQWVDHFASSLRDKGVAIDGKVLRGSFDHAAGKSPLHTITAFATETKLVLRQMPVDDKSNEIPAVPQLLELLDLAGSVVTLDAMHCQKETAKRIVAAEADYILTVKGNQGNLANRLSELFLEYGEQRYRVEGLRKHVTVETSRGRDERREYYTIAVPGEPLFADWAGIKSIGMIFRVRDDGNVRHSEATYFISSLPPKVKKLSRRIRDHWKIENSEHYILDVTFSEDASRIRAGSSPEISAAFRRMALNILQQDTTVKDSIRGKRLRAGWDETVLDAIYAGFNRA
ncbi:Transposase DDE domain protein [Rosistilla carotiformis]|uniref:Transposase DDE domain protein n=2 Tax=Rosistilla carotiformis TaxID=2528017 RepID=A0A518JTY1_9BACT|nr:Transposase DDE domain protein [Rosistilla carotiformis]QDV68936.1 Transposase DDE domain protein [Rosistilla carotiformis]